MGAHMPCKRAAIGGFTLVELVVVILLSGIVALYAVPRWLGQGSFEAQTARDEVVARLRLVQGQNMNEPADRCSWWVTDGSRFAHITISPCAAPPALSGWSERQLARGRLVTLSQGVTLAGGLNLQLRFDRLGRPLGSCLGGCQVTISGGGESLLLAINAEGYVHARD